MRFTIIDLLDGYVAIVAAIVLFALILSVTNTANYDDVDADVQMVLDAGRLNSGTLQQPDGVTTDGGVDVAIEY